MGTLRRLRIMTKILLKASVLILMVAICGIAASSSSQAPNSGGSNGTQIFDIPAIWAYERLTPKPRVSESALAERASKYKLLLPPAQDGWSSDDESKKSTMTAPTTLSPMRTVSRTYKRAGHSVAVSINFNELTKYIASPSPSPFLKRSPMVFKGYTAVYTEITTTPIHMFAVILNDDTYVQCSSDNMSKEELSAFANNIDYTGIKKVH